MLAGGTFARDSSAGGAGSAARAAGSRRGTEQHRNAQKQENSLFFGAMGTTKPITDEMVFNEFRVQEIGFIPNSKVHSSKAGTSPPKRTLK
jgi:hypothetical protein